MLRVTAFLLVICSALDACACNIPVFRYALERWQADQLQLIVLHSQDLTAVQQQVIQEISARSLAAGGTVNMQVQSLDVRHPVPERFRHLQLPAAAAISEPTTWLLARMPQGEERIIWSGSLEDAQSETVYSSPARMELAKRLLSGQASVWLMLSGSDTAETDRQELRLKDMLAQLSEEIPFPDGIGLEGSELYSSIPLTMDFSVLRISRNDAGEQFLWDLVRHVSPERFESGRTLVLPVFGRGRVLEILSADKLDDESIQDLCFFLSGACSCQVKEQNPGFDLLMATDWEETLFLGGESPPDTGLLRQRQPVETGKSPELVPIAPGKSPAPTETESKPREESGEQAAPVKVSGGFPLWWSALGLLIVASLLAVVSRT